MPAESSNSSSRPSAAAPSAGERNTDQTISGQPIPVRGADYWQLERTADRLTLQFTTNTHQLRDARLTIESFCRDGGLDEKCWSEIGLVVNEAVANITRHAYDVDRPMPIDLNAELTADGVTITLRDWGKGETPTVKSLFGKSTAVRTEDAALAEPIPEPGGLGLICMKQLMNDVAFIPQEPGMLLRMNRRRQR